MKCGNLNFLEPSGPLQASNGTALPLHNDFSVFFGDSDAMSFNDISICVVLFICVMLVIVLCYCLYAVLLLLCCTVIVLFCYYLCHPMYWSCVLYHCHRVLTQLQSTNISIFTVEILMMTRYIIILMCFWVPTMQYIVMTLVYHSIVDNDAVPFNVFLCATGWLMLMWYNGIRLVLVGLSMMLYLTLLLVYRRMIDCVIHVIVTILTCWINDSNEMFCDVISVVFDVWHTIFFHICAGHNCRCNFEPRTEVTITLWPLQS